MPRKTSKDASNPHFWIRKLIRCDDYQLSNHLYNKLADGEFALADIENSILSGRISKIEKDELCCSIDHKKYVIIGKSQNGLPFETVGKLIEGFEGEKYFIITAYRST